MELLWLGTAPHVSTLRLPDVIARDQISQAFPLRVCILQVIQDWRWERPENELLMLLEFLLKGGCLKNNLLFQKNKFE